MQFSDIADPADSYQQPHEGAQVPGESVTSTHKNWNAIFDTNKFCGDQGKSHFDNRLLLDNLLGDREGSVPSWEAKVVRDVLSGNSEQPQMMEDSRYWAWLDERECSSGHRRPSSQVLTFSQLQEALQKKRFGHTDLPDADRRLIYTTQLKKAFVLSLVQNANSHEVSVLRDAICKHLTLESAIQVKSSVTKSPTFSLEFHLAHLVLRPTNNEPHAKTPVTTSDDLAFLFDGTSSNSAPGYTLRQAHISIVVCGWNNTRWTGYAFAKSGLDPELAPEHDENDLKQDFFAADSTGDFVQDSDSPIWDARTYWLQVVAVRCQLILKEWVYLVRTVEERVNKLSAERSWSSIHCNTSQEHSNIQTSLDLILRIMQLLRGLIDSLSTTLRAYKRFDAPDGDKCYFSNMVDPSINSYQNIIKESFEKMDYLHSALVLLSDSCNGYATHLGRILNLENHRLTAQSDILAQRGNELDIENYETQLGAKSRAESTVALTQEILKLNQESTEVARATQATQAKTGLYIQTNVELFLLTTPLAIVLQAFSTEKDIFSFPRTTKTFFLSTLVLMVILRFIELILKHSGKMTSLLRRIRSERPSDRDTSAVNGDQTTVETAQP